MTDFPLPRSIQRVRALLPRRIPIASKLALAISALVICGMGALGAIILEQQSRLLEAQLRGFGHVLALQLAEVAREPLLAEDRLALQTLVASSVATKSLLGVAVLDHQGNPLGIGGIEVPGHLFTRVLMADRERAKPIQWQRIGADGSLIQALTVRADIEFQRVRAGFVLVTLDRQPMVKAQRTLFLGVMGATLVLMLLGILLSLAIARRLHRPIGELTSASRAIAQGHYDYRIAHARNDELGELIDAFNGMAEGLGRKERAENALSRYVSRGVAKTVLEGSLQQSLGGRTVRGSVLFADMVGFTALSESMDPQQVAEILNEYFGYITRACDLYLGTVDKFIGDCVMITFGVLEEERDHALQAVSCALLIARIVKGANERRLAAGEPAVDFRIGLNSGTMLAGNLGAESRMQYTVLGDTVNLASRLCAYAESGEILMATDTLSHAGETLLRCCRFAELSEPVSIRGKRAPVRVAYLLDLEGEAGARLDAQAAQILCGSEGDGR